MSDLVPDWSRRARTGLPEAILCEGKSDEQLARILHLAKERGERLFLTRFSEERLASLPAGLRAGLDYEPISRTATMGAAPHLEDLGITVVTAGSSDRPVAEEARRTLAAEGVDAPLVGDVGVAGLWRLLDRIPSLADRRVIVAVAGMEGALFSVLPGLVRGLVIAVPTSVGYGVAAGGRAALSTALASCAPGLVAVNIDNGYGAACAALKVVRPRGGAPECPPPATPSL
jgi:NCAIR mutase (PurE)-related protein